MNRPRSGLQGKRRFSPFLRLRCGEDSYVSILDSAAKIAYDLATSMDVLTLEATQRGNVGNRAKDDFKAGKIPAVIYGHGFGARSISVVKAPFLKLLSTAGRSRLIDVKVENDAPVKALIKEIQRHPLTMDPIHIDFHQVRMDEKMHADVPLKFTGESDAVKVLGGTLVKARDEVEVECLPADLPAFIEVDISKLATFDDVLMIKDLAIPRGVVILEDLRTSVVNVTRPLTEDEMKKLEESQLGDITTVKTESELKAAEKAATEAAEAAPGEEGKAAAKAPTTPIKPANEKKA